MTKRLFSHAENVYLDITLACIFVLVNICLQI